jgi:hypothetical protein
LPAPGGGGARTAEFVREVAPVSRNAAGARTPDEAASFAAPRNRERAAAVVRDMNRLLRTLAAGLVFALAPSASPAAPVTGPATLSLVTHFVPESPAGAGGYDGTLKLQIDRAGIISGTFRPNGNGPFVQVSGGLDGDRIWLDFGSGLRERERISGHYRDGSIYGSTFRGGRLWDFTAKPAAPGA